MISPVQKSVLFLLLCLCALSGYATNDDFETVKTRVVAGLMKTRVEDSAVDAILIRLQSDGSFQNIHYADLSRTAGFPHRRHTGDLVTLARAWQSTSSTYHHDDALKQKIITSLSYWVEHDFFGDNWHDNQITTPTNLVNLMLIIGDELPADLIDRAQPIIGRANMNASGARPSGDRIVIAGILAKNLLFTGNREEFDRIIRLIESEVKFSTGQRGIQHDYSFHHRIDRVNNTTSYGYGKYANAFGEWAYYVANTQYAFSIEKINHLVDYYLDGICKQLVYGIYEDISVKNRSISIKSDFKPRDIAEVERLLQVTDYRREELEEIIRLRKGENKPARSFSKFFWQTEHFVFQRPHFYTTVRMFSTRNRNMEEPYNGPGKTTHHRADGTNYLQLTGDEYHNIWPVYDWQKISGTTILQKPRLPGPDQIQMEGLTDFVGAVTDGMLGAVAFDFRSPHDLVKAKKSWFFFDEEYVCLGTDIGARTNLPVATIINQVLMRGDVTVIQGGKVNVLPRGTHELSDIKGIYHDRVGYLLPEPGKIQISNQTEEGRWSDITDQKNISDEIIREEVFTAWFDHGNRPDSGSYSYIVIPGFSRESLVDAGKDLRGIEILANNGDVQSAFSHKQSICQAVFYRAGEISIPGGLRCRMDSQGAVMLSLQGNRIRQVTVADPSRKLQRMLMTVSGAYDPQSDQCLSIPDPSGEGTILIIDLPQGVYAGKSVTIDLH
jgi:chondroitin AC lyase